MKWLITCLVVAVIAVLAWITLQDTGDLDPRAAVHRARVVAYGRVISSPRPHMVIDEIWKTSGSSEVRIGSVVSVPVADRSFDHGLVCFTPRLFSRRLSASAFFAVRGETVGLPAVSLSELKALCAVAPST